MPEIKSSRLIPSHEAIDALHAAIKQKLGDQFAGIRAEGEVLFLILEDTATAEDTNTALMITEKHDFSQRTPAQLAHKERKTALSTLREKVGKLDVHEVVNKGSKDDIANVLQYLILELEDTKKRGKM